MKIRSDYVSNSSSSSFVVVLPKEYEFNKFIKDIARSTVSNPDSSEDKNWLKGLKERNLRNLDYCLNTYVLLYLGCAAYKYNRKTIRNKKKMAKFFEANECDMKYHVPVVKVVSNDKDKLVVDVPMIASMVTIPKNAMGYSIRRWKDPNEPYEDYRKQVVKAILMCAGQVNCFTNDLDSGLFEITMDTIKNTEDMVAEGVDVKFDDWCVDVGRLKKMLNEGSRIFGIDMHQSGDGEGPTSIYDVSGWDSDPFKYAHVQILNCECG